MSSRREQKKNRSSSRRQGSQGSSLRKRFSFSSSRRGGRNKRKNQSGKDGGSIMSSSSSSAAMQSPSTTTTSSSKSGNHGVAKTKTIPLEGVVWKLRNGLGQLSETVGVGRSWERRRLMLLAGDGDSRSSKLCYYALQEGDASQRRQQQNSETPRGVIDLILERAVICATHLNDTTQPTPYSISIKTKPDGLSSSTEATTKWKLCFDDRKSQMAWLVALTDAVVDATVKEYNAHTLCVAADFHGGWKLYEEEAGMFDSVKDVLLQQDPPASSSSDNRSLSQSLSTTTKDDTSQRSTPSQSPTSSFPPEETLKTAQPLSPPPEKVNDLVYYLPETRFYHILAIVNISIIYAHMSATLAIPLLPVMPWWQTLVVANLCIYCICFVQPPGATPSTEKKKEEEVVRRRSPPNATNSTIGAELLREKEVPLSEDPEETETKTTLKKKEEEEPHHRDEPLSKEEMAAHLHERWAMSAPNVDLSGSWTLLADDAFKAEYDTYLKDLGFNRITRGVACSLIGRTAEETKQSDGGRKLYLKGSNPKGVWERILISSGFPDFDTEPMKKEGMDYKHLKSSIKTADAEDVEAEAWWENRGTVHRSWLRGSTKYGGGDHESRRYLADDGKILVCESVFHGRNKRADVTWRFQRNDE